MGIFLNMMPVQKKVKILSDCHTFWTKMLLNKGLKKVRYFPVITSTISKLFCKGTPVHKLGSNSSLAWYKLSFEPSTTSVHYVQLFI